MTGEPEPARRRFSPALFAAVFVCFALPMLAIFPSCSKERVATESGYQLLTSQTYETAVSGKALTPPVQTWPDAWAYGVLAAAAVGVALALARLRRRWLVAVAALGGFMLLAMQSVPAAGHGVATRAEPGLWLALASLELAPAVDQRPWWRALLVLAGTVAATAALIAVAVGVTVLAQRLRH